MHAGGTRRGRGPGTLLPVFSPRPCRGYSPAAPSGDATAGGVRGDGTAGASETDNAANKRANGPGRRNRCRVAPNRASTVRIDVRASKNNRHAEHTWPGAAAIDAGKNSTPHSAMYTPPDDSPADIASSATA
jgi:hypothetical protein